MCSQAVIRKCSDWQRREEKNTFTSFKIFLSWQKSTGDVLPLQEKHDLGAASSDDAAPPVPSQLMSWESTRRCGEVGGPVSPSSALSHGDNVSTRDVWILAQYSSVLLGFWHESKSLAGSVSIKSLTRIKLKVSGWNPRDGVARVGERCIQTSMGRSAECAHCNPQRGVCPCYGEHHYHEEITIFPDASHPRVLQQQEEAQISRDLAHPGKWASETNQAQQGSKHEGHILLHGITPPVSTARTVILIS